MELPIFSLPGMDITVYGAVSAALCAVFFALTVFSWKRKGGRSAAPAVWFGVLSIVLGLLLGRGIYCAVRYNAVFFDGMGDSLGILPFFTMEEGSVSVVGVLLGCLLAAALAARFTGARASEILDCAALPGVMLFALLRLVEPLSGQGFGPLVSDPFWCRVPLSIDSGWGEWSFSVCFLEFVLLLLAFLALLKIPCRKGGTRAMYALTLIPALQLIPEMLRQDNVLMIFIFAPVTQMGYAALLFGTLAAALRPFPRKIKIRELGLMLLGIALLVAGEFALDKSEWSHALLYAVMGVILAAMTGMTLRRIRLRDQ